MHRVEWAASGGLSTGGGLAAVAAVLAGRGQVGPPGPRLLSEATFDASMANVSELYDANLGVRLAL